MLIGKQSFFGVFEEKKDSFEINWPLKELAVDLVKPKSFL